MKFTTFNIRCDYDQDGKNSFRYRRELILKKIAAERPDAIGFQEVLPHVQRWLRENLSGYTVIGCGRDADFGGEAMTIAVRNETAELLGLSTFWLSPEPYRPGSRYENQSDCPRTCAAAELLVQGAPGPIRLYNTHLDHIGAEARAQGLTQVLRRMEEDMARLPMPALLMGDMNALPDSPELAPVGDFPALGLTDLTAGIPVTFHNYGLPGEEPCKIDYIYATPQFKAERVERWMDEEDGVFLSDHYPVCAEVSLR